jgi:uncharacterized caspase-like protein
MNRFIASGFAPIFGLALMVSGLVPGAAMAADIALVIGNHDYKYAPDAESAEIDAREVAAALEDGGYDVTLGIDMIRREMRDKLSRFAGKIGTADRVVIFFSGHALRSNGASYLAPIDQRNNSLVRVLLDGIPLDLVLRLAQSRSGRAVVFLDAAQFDGFSPNANAEPGLATIEPREGVLIVSAAAPGRASAAVSVAAAGLRVTWCVKLWHPVPARWIRFAIWPPRFGQLVLFEASCVW